MLYFGSGIVEYRESFFDLHDGRIELIKVIGLDEVFVGTGALAAVRDVAEATDIGLGAVAGHSAEKASMLADGTDASVVVVEGDLVDRLCVVSGARAHSSRVSTDTFSAKLWTEN
jgi:hypothetical protein